MVDLMQVRMQVEKKKNQGEWTRNVDTLKSSGNSIGGHKRLNIGMKVNG
jgi:hypothetical protein